MLLYETITDLECDDSLEHAEPKTRPIKLCGTKDMVQNLSWRSEETRPRDIFDVKTKILDATGS